MQVALQATTEAAKKGLAPSALGPASSELCSTRKQGQRSAFMEIQRSLEGTGFLRRATHARGIWFEVLRCNSEYALDISVYMTWSSSKSGRS